LNLKVWLGLLISAVFLWLSARNVDFVEAWRHIQSMNAWVLIPYSVLIILEVVIRAWKWQILLTPVKRCSFVRLNAATLIGLFANNVLPARAGEFVRAYAGSRLESISYSTSFATVVLDRLLDGLTVSAIFVLALLFQPLPDEIKLAGYAAAIIYLGTLVVLVGLIVKQNATVRLLEAVLRPFPLRLRDLGLRIVRSFVEGLSVFRNPRLLAGATAISFLIWVGYALSLYLMFLAFNIDLTVAHAFVVLLILTIVLTLPSSPGFVGAMEWAIVFGLGLYAVNPDQAFAVAIVYHVTQYLPITIAGLVAVWVSRLSVGELAHVQGPPAGGEGPSEERGSKSTSDGDRQRLSVSREAPREPASALRSDPH
jgi:uncharacterized protein (TIRG00374 family)